MSRQNDTTGDIHTAVKDSGVDRLLRVSSFAALIVLAFIAGAILTAGDVFPGPQISRAYQGGKALYDKLTKYHDYLTNDLWFPQRRPEKGVTTYVAGKAQEGFTLYTSGSAAAAFLIDMQGHVVHEWRRPFSSVWQPAAGGVQRPQPDSHVYFRRALAYPNGDLLAVYESVGDTPFGYGLVKLDRNSEVVWNYPGRAHHGIDIGADGNIYVLTHEFTDKPLKDYAHIASPRLDDFLVVLSPDGEELKKISLLNAVARSKYRLLLNTISSPAFIDPLHSNSVSYITDVAAANFAFGKEGQVLLSFREPSAVVVLDVDTEEIVWAARGSWIGQHDPEILANGHILLFDNYGNFEGPEGRSRVIEFDPRTMEIVWQYSGTAERPLDSHIRSSQQRLANGNTLITESNGGRILEVTPDREIVWEFLNPVRDEKEGGLIPIVSSAMRLDRKHFDPAQFAPRKPDRISMRTAP